MANTPAKFLKDVAGQVYAVVVDGVVYGIAGADGQAEAERKVAESERVAAEEARAAGESARVSAEAERATAETQRATDQAKNNADQALNNEAIKKLSPVILNAGQYDAATHRPTITGEPNRTYFVPMKSADDNKYVEWMWVGSAWEKMGITTAEFSNITTDQIDNIMGGASEHGDSVLSLTGLTYLLKKLGAGLKASFAVIGHKHDASDITSGVLSISNGGTGAATAAGARNALGLGDTTGALPVANGGTGAVTAAEALAALGVTVGEADAPETGAPGSVYIKML